MFLQRPVCTHHPRKISRTGLDPLSFFHHPPNLPASTVLSPPSVLRSRRVLLPLLLQLRIEEISFPDRRHMIPVPVEIADRRSQTYTHIPNQRSPSLFVPVM